MTKTHIAHCACGDFRAEAEGEPTLVSMCHCLECQRRSGSPFGVGAWFERAHVRLSGAEKTFARFVEDRKITNHFCPRCGSCLFWEADKRPGMIAISVGAFGDPDFSPPARSIYESSKHHWIAFGVDIPCHDQAP
jgi:hypothetical protein